MCSRRDAYFKKYLEHYEELSEELTPEELSERAFKPTAPCSQTLELLSTLSPDRWVGPWWGGRDAYRSSDPFDLLCSPEEWALRVELGIPQKEVDETATLANTEESMVFDHNSKKEKAKLAVKSPLEEAMIGRALTTGTMDPRETGVEPPDEHCGMAGRKKARRKRR